MKKHFKFVACLLSIAIVFFSGLSSLQAETIEKVKTSMQMLKEKTSYLGAPKLEGNTLYFGDMEMNGYYDVVDEVADYNGGTATIFAVFGDEYKRIATNVIKDGNRAVGTILDPHGTVIKKIRNGEAYYGEADILGTKYITGYEPIIDASSKIIGILYVGYKI
ncbi:MAG: Cache 3/Cache 2 fusion domain-containing protein [Candidatus Omnitrophica bacterium]|nr:Cache 3/Cache 2 fusion domain-containing protein [Candidatus Omnitrophota bacterium]